MNILVISPGILPIPATKGGAVETLVDMFITDDTLYKNNSITVYSCCDNNNKKTKMQSKIIYINKDTLLFKVERVFRHLVNKIPNVYIGNAYICKVIRDIKRRKIRYDMIIVENQPEYAIPIKKNNIEGKMVLHLHNDYLNPSTKLCKKTLECYDLILPVSRIIKKRIEKIKSNKKVELSVLYNGIDLKKFNNNDKKIIEKYRRHFGVVKDDFVFMYSGRLVREKGVNELILAFNSLCQKTNNVKLLIVGKISNKKYYKNLMVSMKQNSDNIIFVGDVEYAEIQNYYAISDVGVVPSLCKEAFGLTVVEFLASGSPVIITDNGAMKEIVNNPQVDSIIVRSDRNFVKNLEMAMHDFVVMNKQKLQFLCDGAVKNSRFFSLEKYRDNYKKLLGLGDK